MTRLSDASSPARILSTFDLSRAARDWILATGGIYLAVGLIALSSAAVMAGASALVIGLTMMIVGLVEVIGAFRMKVWRSQSLSALLGVLYLIAGLLVSGASIVGDQLMRPALGSMLAVAGVTRIVLAGSMNEDTPWIWVVYSGVFTLALGIACLTRWPPSGVETLCFFLPLDLLIAGTSQVAVGLALKPPRSNGSR